MFIVDAVYIYDLINSTHMHNYIVKILLNLKYA